MTTLHQTNRYAAPAEGAIMTAARFQGAACETPQQIMDIAVTLEAFGVTFLGEALAASERGELPLNPDALGTLVAARAAEQAHFEVLTEAGAQPLTESFTVPDPAILANVGLFFTTLASIEEAAVAAYLAAAQEFVISGQPDMAQLALQIGAVEAEHRAGARFFAIEAGALEGVPNDVAFEKALFASVSEAAALVEELGFIGGSGAEITYPGPGDIDATGVSHLRP